MQHLHRNQLEGSAGALNYFRHCMYDGIAEWQVRHKADRLDPDTIKVLKDRLLRLPLHIEFTTVAAEAEAMLLDIEES